MDYNVPPVCYNVWLDYNVWYSYQSLLLTQLML